ncbi:3757_t:CDS:2, partial [Acaulospora colombiana]
PHQRYPKSLEEKEINSFLNSKNKMNREKKFRIQEPPVISPTSSEEESSTFEASNVHNSLRIEKENQNETSMEYSVNIVSDIAYEDQVEDYKAMKNIDEQSARTLVYNEIKLLLLDITDVKLHTIYVDEDR